MIGFDAFLRLVRGSDVTPYPWQRRLAERCAAGEPPDVIAVPTGAGKTTTVDVLVWALAYQAERPAADRTVGVRIVWAIDRRILVDEVHGHAQQLARRLSQALRDDGDPLHDVAARLALLSDAEPLVATRWRGGLDAHRERHSPLQPQVITSTVAQIGSRLLFRGYGVASGSLALEAGQAACDTTICLDEAHLAEPFRETVAAIRAHRRASERTVRLPGLRAVTLTATPPQVDGMDVLELDDDDRAALGPRFEGTKEARLVEAPSGSRESDVVRLLAGEAVDSVRSGAATVACVVNTVRRARDVFDALRKALGDVADVTLLVGPQRPADRAAVLAAHRATLFGGVAPERPLVCVATQTFEVGLDADVEALVTESASAAALVQRFGRLNRSGTRVGRATVVRDEGRWLYAHDEPTAWSWLRGLERPDGTLDVSVRALERAAPPPPRKAAHAAVLTPEVVELLAATATRPARWADPDPDSFLRGADAEPAADVAFCWRADLRPAHTDAGADGYRAMLLELAPPHPQELLTLSLAGARALIAARYVQPGASPAAAARVAGFEADVEHTMLDALVPSPDTGWEGTRVPFVVLRRGRACRGALGRDPGALQEQEETIALRDLQAGDVVILPTRAGGADALGLAPAQPRTEHATDVAPDVRPTDAAAPVRVTPEALAAAIGGPVSPSRWEQVARACRSTERAIADAQGAAGRQEAVEALIERLAEWFPDHPGLGLLRPGAPERAARAVSLRAAGRVDENDVPVLDECEQGDEEDGRDTGAESQEVSAAGGEPSIPVPPDALPPLGRVWVLVPSAAAERERRERLVTDDTGPPTLDQHATAVCREVTRIATRLRLDAAVGEALALAARAHDHGKADPRVQTYLRRGVDAFGTEPLAKSELGVGDPRADRVARRLAGLPRHLDHERASVAVLAEAIAAGRVDCTGLDADLVLYLDGASHGRGRPWPRVPHGGRPPRPFHVEAAGIAGSARGDATDGWTDGAWLERFWRVVDRYGAWGVAYLESLLMLADRAVSARGE